MNIIRRNNIKISGSGERTMIFAHGYGCDQNVWRHLLPAFEKEYQVIVFDHVGSGESDLAVYDRVKYGTLHGYAEDLLEICETLEIKDPIFVGHSVSCMIGALAAIKNPDLFHSLIFLGPSPSFINEENYIGGFDRATINSVLESLDNNFVEWSKTMAPLIMGNLDKPELSQELVTSFCRSKPDIAKHFAQVTFLADHREDVRKVLVPTLLLQCSNDSLAPVQVGDFLHRNVPENDLVHLTATGHCPHMSAPKETILVMKGWLAKQSEL
jgi:sigma-B regulation protein RsbQ